MQYMSYKKDYIIKNQSLKTRLNSLLSGFEIFQDLNSKTQKFLTAMGRLCIFDFMLNHQFFHNKD